MSLESTTETSSNNNRDWFFPSPSFIHSTLSTSSPNLPRYPRRFSTTPRLSQPLPPDSKLQKTPTFRRHVSRVSNPDPTSTGDYSSSYGSKLRRRVSVDQRNAKPATKLGENDAVSDKKRGVSKSVPVSSSVTISGYNGVRVRWRMAFALAVLITAFASLLHKNFSLHNRVDELQEQIAKLNFRLRACNLLDSIDLNDSISQENGISSQGLKNLALIISLVLLSIPLLIFKYVDYVSKSRISDNVTEQVVLNKQLAYKVDVFFSVHSYAKPLALLVATLLLIFLGGLSLYGVTTDGLADCLWLSWTFVANSGNHANSEGMGPRLVSVSISFGGMLIFAMMLGLVSDAISEKFDSLRKGRSEGSLLNQLAIANESLGGGIVVVMAERDKEEMELDIAKMEFDFRGTSVSVSKARAIVVLAEDGNADQSDARALRTVLSLTGVKEGLRGHIVVELGDLDNEVLVKLVGGDLVETVVAHDVIGRLMIQCARQPGLAQIWEDILGFENCEFYIKRWPQLDEMQFEDVLISFPDAIPCGVKVASKGGKIILNPEDSFVLQEGDEVLVIAEDDDSYSPAALPMLESLLLPKCTLFMMPVVDSPMPGVMDLRVNEASSIHITRPTRNPQKILLCGWRRDIDDMIVVWRGYLPRDFVVPKSEEKILFCGWRRDMEDMIMVILGANREIAPSTFRVHFVVLDAFLAPKSELWMFNDVPESERDRKLIEGGLDISRLENIVLVNREGNAVIRRHLESLPLESFDSILILADESVEDSAIQADSRSLATLLLIRDIQAKRLPYRDSRLTQLNRGSVSQGSWIGEMQQASDKSVIISEILDPRTKNLLSMSKISDYVLSNELVSMGLAMVAEDRQISDVLEELFAEEGNELQIRPADLYLREGEELSFYEVLLRARQRREIVIGYRSVNAERAIINPPAKTERRKWSSGDVFVVIAEKE
ncbi:hypothetical protein ACFE04_004970 [Oxalis oulophora]